MIEITPEGLSSPVRSGCAVAAYDKWHQRLDVDEAADSPWHRMVKQRLRPNADLHGKESSGNRVRTRRFCDVAGSTFAAAVRSRGRGLLAVAVEKGENFPQGCAWRE